MADTFHNYVNGEWVESSSGETFESVEPADPSRTLGEFQDSNEEDVQEAVEAAVAAQEEWRALSRIDRAQYLKEFFIELDKREEELGELVSRECGKEIAEGKADVVEASHMARYAFGLSRHPTGEVVESEIPAKDSYVHRKPVGVVGSIKPWNFPIALPLWDIAITLEEGNTMVFKPAEQTPKCGVRILEIFDEIGLPDGVLNLVTGHAEAGGAVVEHPDVDSILFTGSCEVGHEILEKAEGMRGKQATCEMGGKNGIIITENADLDTAVNSAVISAFKTTGQRCVSTERLIVHEDILPEFRDKFVAVTEQISVGHPVEEDVFMGPVIDEQAVEKITMWNEKVRDHDDCEVLVDREDIEKEDYPDARFIGPFVYECEYDPANPVLHQEVFGPHCAIIPYQDFDEAIRIHNNTEYGLAFSIITEDYKEARKARQECEFGVGYHNLPSIGAEVHLPFGGVKQSGSGISAGKDIINAVTERASWTVNHEDDIQMAQGLDIDMD
ncbi:MAG: aldehyde dehydrogenase family protein [Candidatus Nanohaloarchaea archaeon]|nr:aldehyde dehydrogenase family protein [Candidatus Nanohaloarchaea archaeon]